MSLQVVTKSLNPLMPHLQVWQLPQKCCKQLPQLAGSKDVSAKVEAEFGTTKTLGAMVVV